MSIEQRGYCWWCAWSAGTSALFYDTQKTNETRRGPYEFFYIHQTMTMENKKNKKTMDQKPEAGGKKKKKQKKI